MAKNGVTNPMKDKKEKKEPFKKEKKEKREKRKEKDFLNWERVSFLSCSRKF